MSALARTPADAYRRIDLDARIEAASGEGLTRICLEEAVAALGQALAALERSPGMVPSVLISRAQVITLWLAQSVSPDNPLREVMVEFYAGIAARLARNLLQANAADLAMMRGDLNDLLEAAALAKAA